MKKTILGMFTCLVALSSFAREGDTILKCKIESKESHLKEIELVETDLEYQYAIYETNTNGKQNPNIYVINDAEYWSGKIDLSSTGEGKSRTEHALVGKPSDDSKWLIKSSDVHGFWEVPASCEVFLK